MKNKSTSLWKSGLPLLAAVAAWTQPAEAARISNPVASFSGLDKITGRITTFDVYIGETVQFGALQVTPRACYNRDETEAQHVDAFVEVDEITLDRKIKRIFTGWMFADSPALNAIEHPIFDVWLKECKQKTDVPPPKDLKIPPNGPPTPPKNPENQPHTDNEGQTPPATDPQTDAPVGGEPPPEFVDPTPLPPLEDGTNVEPLPEPPDSGQLEPGLPPVAEPDNGFGLPPESIPENDPFGGPVPDNGDFPPAPDGQSGQPGGGQGGGFQ